MAIGHLCGYLEAKWLFLVRFEVDILKNVAKIVNFRPRIGQL